MKETEGKEPGITTEGASNSYPNLSTQTDASEPYGAAFLL